jgi:hypothetical protein
MKAKSTVLEAAHDPKDNELYMKAFFHGTDQIMWGGTCIGFCFYKSTCINIYLIAKTMSDLQTPSMVSINMHITNTTKDILDYIWILIKNYEQSKKAQ